jgi:hypothetical protein
MPKFKFIKEMCTISLKSSAEEKLLTQHNVFTRFRLLYDSSTKTTALHMFYIGVKLDVREGYRLRVSENRVLRRIFGK